MIYSEDSFFTLSIPGQIGLGLLSLTLALTICLAVHRIRARRWMRLGAALIAFVLFVWLSPQIYYQYYRLIFDGLPQQIVVPAWPDVLTSLRILFFSDRASLSFHGQAVLGWMLIGVACWGRAGRKSP